MQAGSTHLKRAFAAGLLGALLAAGPAAIGATQPFNGAGSYSLATVNFTYDGAAPAVLLTGSEKTNLGSALFQVVSETTPSTTPCVAPDGSAGTAFNLVQSNAAGTFPQGQLYFRAGGAPASQCVSSTTGSNGGSITYEITGGSGKFVGASGSSTITYAGQTLVAAGSPPGSTGLFGAGQFTFTGSLSR